MPAIGIRPKGMMVYENLDKDVRGRMLIEFAAEQRLVDRYQIRALTELGQSAWAEEFPEACRSGDDRSLLLAMDADAFWQPTPTGRPMPSAWRRRTCVSEFNTFYVRGLASVLIGEGVTTCEVYRADNAAVPDSCSELEGRLLDPNEVYRNHRRRYHPTVDATVIAVPFQPGCHHSIRRVVS